MAMVEKTRITPGDVDAEESTANLRPTVDPPGYRVSEDGRVFTIKHGGNTIAAWREMKLRTDRKGYRFADFGIGGSKSVRRFVHRLVLEAFVGLRPPGMECCHNDGNPLNNRLDNLRWDTSKANAEDRRRHGRTVAIFGERHGNARLNEEQVKTMRTMRAEGQTCKRIAELYGFPAATVRHAINGYSWKHLSPPSLQTEDAAP